MEERHRRRKYIVVSGVPEHESGSVEERRKMDSETVKDIIEELGIRNFELDEITRVGIIRSSRP